MNENLENKMRELCSVSELNILHDLLKIMDDVPEKKQKNEIQNYIMEMKI